MKSNFIFSENILEKCFEKKYYDIFISQIDLKIRLSSMNVFDLSSDRKRKNNSQISNLLPLVKVNEIKREPFHLTLNSKNDSNDAISFDYVISKFNPAKSENGILQLPGKWSVGLSSFLMNSELISLKKISRNSVGFLYLVIKLEGVKAFALPINYYQHKLYTRSESVHYANLCLSRTWLNLCHSNDKGINEVGCFFISNIFCFYENKAIDSYIYIKSIGSGLKENWKLFLKLFDTYRKDGKSNSVECIEVYTSSELISFFGGFTIPKEIEDYSSDWNEYYDGLRITKRVMVIPYPQKSENINLRAEILQPMLLPLSINFLTNILNSEPSAVVNITDKQFARFQLLTTIPLNNDLWWQNSSNISYFATNIKFRELPSDSRIERISVSLTDSYSEKLLSLNVGSSIITLEFLPT